MIANVSAHRRANAFAQALEDQAAQQPEASAEPSRQDRLLALANGLGDLPKPTMDPEVKVVQRAQLVAAMEAMLQEGTAAGGAPADPTVPEQRTPSGRGAHRATALRRLRPRTRWTKGLAAGGLTVGVAAGAFGGVAAASSDALPGDSLYGLKRGMEDLKLGFADDDADRGEIHLDHASTRLGEARRLLERTRSGDLDHETLNEIRRTLDGMQHDVSEGHRLLRLAYERDGRIGPMATLDSFARNHRGTWDGLRAKLPPQLTDVRDQVTSVFDAIDQQVAPLKSQLDGPPKEDGGRPGEPGAPAGPTGPGPSRQAPPNPPVRPSGGTVDTPGPSGGSSKDTDEGLLGGSTGGLLDPDGPSTSAPPSQDGPPESPAPGPDVTLPPLLPGILPGLGIDGEDAP
ncbi:DUF5667 domain-containing protein [Streptomyces roseolilacinus]|uniref:DUF5667 domain-containing protein n=1 Tax=Streptomyces roseolilacinus TaxID=66904 RepID=A0A918EJV3_9ACTN|nr:DUF5667 domain-containing protein [Streptomyces roseolilacinus]GGP92923.1 hypothetical protein GCM10010249_08790 [Streptomyces roseolilacinus]